MWKQGGQNGAEGEFKLEWGCHQGGVLELGWPFKDCSELRQGAFVFLHQWLSRWRRGDDFWPSKGCLAMSEPFWLSPLAYEGASALGVGGRIHYWLLTGRDQQCCYCTSSCPRQATPSTAPQKEPPDPAGQQCWDCEDLPPDINKSLALSCIWKDLTLGRPRSLTAIPAVNCQWPVFPAAEE